jgi:hypothetical protein
MPILQCFRAMFRLTRELKAAVGKRNNARERATKDHQQGMLWNKAYCYVHLVPVVIS